MQLKSIQKNLTVWVLLAIALGILLGHFYPDTAVAMQPLGKSFIEAVS